MTLNVEHHLDLNFSFCYSKSNPLVSCLALQLDTSCILPSPCSHLLETTQIFLSYLPPPNHYFISAPNSSRYFLGTYRVLLLGKQVGVLQNFISPASPNSVPQFHPTLQQNTSCSHPSLCPIYS